jgi:CRISPR-associated protein Cas1
MRDRILDFSQKPASLRVKYRQLVVKQDELLDTTIPLEDIAVVIVANSQVTFSQAVLEGLAENSGILIACDHKSLPVGMFVPLLGHHVQTKRFAAQAAASVPTRKRLWQQLVRAKVHAQAYSLEKICGKDHGLHLLAGRVKSGDPSNIEAQAARRYWAYLFGKEKTDKPFKRDPDGHDVTNACLNYGYGVLRAIVARSLCASGLHPSLGIHHHNQYNPYCLADDLMEPFRPTVDQAVYEYLSLDDAKSELTTEVKAFLIGRITSRYHFADEQRTIFDVMSRISASLAQIYMGEQKTLDLPNFSIIIEKGEDYF